MAVLGVALTLFTSALDIRAGDSKTRVELTCPNTWVLGFPAFATVTIARTNDNYAAFLVPNLDLSSELKLGIGIALKCETERGKTVHLGFPLVGDPGDSPEMPPRWDLEAGETASFTFEVNQLWVCRLRLEPPVLAPSEDYRVTALFRSRNLTSSASRVRVRVPTEDEKRFIEAMEKQGLGKKWFPAVVAKDELKIPEDIQLPAETAQIRDFIKLLRLAVRDAAAALKEIEDKKDSWGYLQDTVTELKYECAAKSKGKDSAAAQDIRKALAADAKTKGRLTRIDKTGGLLDHFAEMKPAKPKDK